MFDEKETKKRDLIARQEELHEKTDCLPRINVPRDQLFLQRQIGNSYLQDEADRSQTLQTDQKSALLAWQVPDEADSAVEEPQVDEQPKANASRYLQAAQDAASENETIEPTAEVEQAIERARGGGQPLDSDVRAEMEPFFGADFSHVRVHADIKADRLSRRLGARAFTAGNDIFFREGEFKTANTQGRELLVHELTHVLEQRSMSEKNSFARELGNRDGREVGGLNQKIETGVSSKVSDEDVSSRRNWKLLDTPSACYQTEKLLGTISSRGVTSFVIQMAPITRGNLEVQLIEHGLGKMTQWANAEKKAVNAFIDALGGKLDSAANMWFVLSGGGAGAALTSRVPEPRIRAIAIFFITIGVFVSRGSIISDCKVFLESARKHCLKQVDENSNEHKSVVYDLAKKFVNKQPEDLLDTKYYSSILQEFDDFYLEVPSDELVINTKWNKLCKKWNDHVMASDLYQNMTATAKTLLMEAKPIPPTPEPQIPPLILEQEEEEPLFLDISVTKPSLQGKEPGQRKGK